MDVVVDVPTHELLSLSNDYGRALKVAGIIKPFHDEGMSFRVAVANEPMASWEGGSRNGPLLPQALENMVRALNERGMSDVTVTVPFFFGVVTDTYPPSKGRFGDKYVDTMRRVASILHRTGGEFMIHLYPFFGRIHNPKDISLDLALGNQDPFVHGDQKKYKGLLGMQVAATRAALVKLDQSYSTMPLTIGECGWPSDGHADATIANADAFTKNTIRAAENEELDPYLRTLYLFEGFDEQKKSSYGHGGTHSYFEDHFGLLKESGAMKFDVKL